VINLLLHRFSLFSKLDLMSNVFNNFPFVTSYRYNCEFDSSGAVGRRYRRADEIGVPLCITVDFESLEDGCVTVRDRDSMQQRRVPISDLETIMYQEIELSDD
jgi:glycyl-tRNA synthetase (class II)